MKVDQEKLGIEVHGAEEDQEKAAEIVMAVFPSLKGKTVNQIEIALEYCLYAVKNGLTVN